MRLTLRTRILLLAVAAPLLTAVATTWHLHRIAVDQARREAHDSMVRAALVLEEILVRRLETFQGVGAAIARDPRFLAAVAGGGGAGGSPANGDLRAVALEFAQRTRSDLFEVFDARGRLLVSSKEARSTPESRAWIEPHVLAGRPARGPVTAGRSPIIVVVVPVVADGRVAGALILGDRVGPALAAELRILTRSEVTFFVDGRVAGSTLAPREQDPAREFLATRGAGGTGDPAADDALLLARPLPGAGRGDHWVVLQRSMGAETAYMSAARGGVATTALCVVLAGLAFGVWTSGRIVRPLRLLVRAAEGMEKGDYDAEIETGSRDEIGYLGARFDAMRRREREYVATLQEVDRIKSEFIDLASHELRTPITVIRGYHDLLEQGSLGPVTPRQKQALGAIEKSLDGLVRITEDAVHVSRIRGERLTLDVAEYDLGDLVTHAVSQAQQDAHGRRVAIVTDVASDLPRVLADGPRLTIALAHLVRNAIRFTPDGGEVTVRARRGGGGFELAVTDRGIGIPADKKAHLFDRSFMVRGSSHHHSSHGLEFGSAGLGLGLAIARGIVEAHGGELGVDSEVNHGSTFTIRVPAAGAAGREEVTRVA